MKFVVSRDPLLSSCLLLPSLTHKLLPGPVSGRATTYHFWARNALFHGLRVLGIKFGDKVLVPAFHCRTVVEPVLQFGCQIVFYNVHRDGSVDLEDIHQKIDSQTKAVIAIHYFGVPQAVEQLQALCQHYSLFLIEDCAHILMGEINGAQIGSFGDVSIFSWRKFFPVYDGGILVRNQGSSQAVDIPWDKINGWFQLKIMKNLLEKSFRDRARQKKPALLLAESFSNELLGPLGIEKNSRAHVQSDTQKVEFDMSQVNWPMSRWSQSILKKIDLPSVIQKRKAHSGVMWRAIQSFSDIAPWDPTEAPSLCAWAFPVIAPSRRDVHVKLREKGIQAFTWGGVIHPTLPLEKFPDAKFLYEHLILLPNQQSLTQAEIDLVLKGLESILENKSLANTQLSSKCN